MELLGRLPNRRLQAVAQRQIDDLVAREPYPQLVRAVERGPSWKDATWPVPTSIVWSVPLVRERANLLEYLIHNEDVRRAQPGWAPRTLPAEVQTEVWRRLPATVRLTMRALPLGVALARPGQGGEVRTGRAKRHGVAVTVTGEPVELALFAFGRHAVARVDYDGEPGDIATVLGTRMGI